MEKVTLLRISQSDQGTEGVLVTSTGFACRSLELPWRDNRRNASCIPADEYEVVYDWSPHFRKYLYHVLDVPGRYGIRFHGGNVAGDVSRGYRSHSYGCILLGKYSGTLWGQRAVLLSRVTLRKFINVMGKEPFTLKIMEVY